MQTWKLVIYGITGDLAKRKILPAVAQFAELNQEKVVIELIGYSRSKPDEEKVLDILNENTSTKKHVVQKISYVQGNYSDSKIFFNFISDLKENERLVLYLAIPPELFTDILKNSCPYSTKEIDLIIEKPFGRILEEAERMLDIITACDLHGHIHFSDHYLFKSPTIITKSDWQRFKEIENKELNKIEIKALESIGVKDRAGYYEQTGALKDIFVHLYSLLDLGLKYYSEDSDWSNVENFEVRDLILGQYSSYISDSNLDSSNTDTYFKINSELKINNKNIELEFESGKSLGLKNTEITMYFTDDSKLVWRINPESYLELIKGSQKLFQDLSDNEKMDHTNLFEDLLEHNFERFVTNKNILSGWKFYNKIKDFKENKSIQPIIYQDNLWPFTAVE